MSIPWKEKNGFTNISFLLALPGKYAFIEASDNFNARRQRGFKARLVSPRILLPRACFSLDYHMYGEDMGSLKIIVKGENGETTLWEKIGNQGDHWHELELSIEQVSEYSVCTASLFVI